MIESLKNNSSENTRKIVRHESSILVVSCDKYSDLWQPFFTLFWRYWNDCPFDVYLLSNFLTYPDPRVKTLAMGEDKNWSGSLLEALKQIDTPYLILMLEDFFFRKPVNTDEIFRCIEALKALNGRMLRLIPRPKPDKPVLNCSFLGYIRATSAFRISTQGSLWEKSALMSLLRDGENIWEFEINGTKRIRNQTGYYCVWQPVLTYHHHVVERGKWFRSEARQFRAARIGCDFSKRQIMTAEETFRWYVRKISAFPKQLISWEMRQKITDKLRRSGIFVEK